MWLNSVYSVVIGEKEKEREGATTPFLTGQHLQVDSEAQAALLLQIITRATI